MIFRGTGFKVFGDVELLLHFGKVFVAVSSGNDISVSLQKVFGRPRHGLTARHKDKAATKESELFAFIYDVFTL